MADINKIAEYFPGARDFHPAEMIAFRGDVLSYRANLKTAGFSTDAQGFRHSTFENKPYSVADCIRSRRYGLVLGASNIFGAGVAGNENTLASLLADRFGFPFGNASMPGANSRTLNALLIGLMAGSAQPPAIVLLSNGGDLGNFCDAGYVDPIFGSPNHLQSKLIRSQEQPVQADNRVDALLVFTSLWLSAIATVCRARKVPLVLLHQSTFFEKKAPSARERECKLGEATSPGQKRQFQNFRKSSGPFFAKRQELARRFNLPIVGVGLTEKLTFLDEFHLDPEGMKVMSEAAAEVIAPILDTGGTARAAEA